MEYTGDGLSWFVPGIYNSIAASYLASLLLLFTYRAGHFERRDVFHVLAAALEFDAGLFAFAFFGDLDFKLAFFAAEHVARGGGVGIGVTHGGLLNLGLPGPHGGPAIENVCALVMPKSWPCGIHFRRLAGPREPFQRKSPFRANRSR